MRKFNLSKRQQVSLVAILITVSVLSGFFVGSVYSQSGVSGYYSLTAGVYPGALSYTVWRSGSYYYAKDVYGYVPTWGTGSTNASYVINECTYATSIQTYGGMVKLLNGVYVLDSPIRLYTIVSLFGESLQTLLDVDSGITGIEILGTNVTGIRKCQVNTLSISEGAIGIYAAYIQLDNYFENLYFYGQTNTSFLVYGGSWANTFNNFNMVGATLYGNNEYGLRLVQQDYNYGNHGNRITNLIFSGYTHPLLIQGAGNKVSGCYFFRNNNGYGIEITGDNSNGNEIMGNYFENIETAISISCDAAHNGRGNLIDCNDFNGGALGEIGISIGRSIKTTVTSANNFWVWPNATIQIGADALDTIIGDVNVHLDAAPTTGDIIDNGLGSTVPDTYVKALPNIDWIEGAPAGSGAVTQYPSTLIVATGATASSSASAYTILQNMGPGFSIGGVSYDKGLIVEFELGRYNSDAEFSGAVQIKVDTTIGVLGGKGMGFNFDNNDVYGEAYGSSRGTTAKLATLVNERGYLFRMEARNSYVCFYINNVLLGNLTGAYVPTGTITGSYVFVSAANGVSGGVDGTFYFGDVKGSTPP